MDIREGYLIYHPKREVTRLGSLKIYHDKFGGNEDPYIWNKRFLHTYCHITQLPNEVGQVNFWISGDTFPEFNKLYCDCVFVIAEKHFWNDANHIARNEPIVEDCKTYEHHYKWGDEENGHHKLTKRRRYTLKADSKLSFQPQDLEGNLIDIMPFLKKNGLTNETLRKGIKANFGSKPFRLGESLGKKLYEYLFKTASIKLMGKHLANKHPNWKKSNAKTNVCC
jgi:hypothetical protein